MLTEQLLNSAFYVPEQPNTFNVFEPLVNAVLAEQAKRQTSSSLQSSFTSLAKMKLSTLSGGNSPSSGSLSSSSKPATLKLDLPMSEASSTTIPKSQFAHLSKPSPPTMLRIKGNFDTLSHGDVIAAMESFGKTKSLLLFKSKQEATVCFENKEDAAKLKSIQNLEIKGVSLTFVAKQDSVSEAPHSTSTEDQKQPPPEKPTVSRQSVSGRNMVLLPMKTLLSLQIKSKKNTVVKLVKKAKVLVSKGKNVSKKQAFLTVKADNLAAKQPEKSESIEAPKPEKTITPGNPGQKSNKKSKVAAEDSGNVLKKTAKSEKVSTVTVAKKNQGEEYLPKVGTATTPMLKGNVETSVGKVIKLSEQKVLLVESSENLPPSSKKMEEVAAKPLNTSSDCAASGTQTLKAEILKTSVREFVVAAENPVQVLETKSETATKIAKQTHVNKASNEMKNVTSAELLALGKTGVAEPTKRDSFAKKEQKQGAEKFSPPKFEDAQPPVSTAATAAGKPSTDPPPKQQIPTEGPKTSVKTVTQVQMKTLSNPDSTDQNPKANVKPFQTNPVTAGAPIETAPTVRREEMETNLKAAKTSPTIKTSTAQIKKQPTVPTCPAFDTSLTVGERIVPEYLSQLNLNSKEYVLAESVLMTGPFTVDSTLLLITNLPVYNSCSYTEEEVANLLCTYGFQYEHDNIYIIPQGCMAFVLLPNERSVMDLIIASVHNHLFLKQHKLGLHIVKKDFLMTPWLSQNLPDRESVEGAQD
ncbi:hypothetical protein ATANTOWER_031921 [Ataeniobius toweri]|uniref:RRM domain-containing protein n=1 Tax=Ataeniobius toweri TaxID=208326 RepID=A0ABU7B559_9TELE|nr:hypothetical protein [Ataeniobius toweri]